jgi:hypothetical protein
MSAMTVFIIATPASALLDAGGGGAVSSDPQPRQNL